MKNYHLADISIDLNSLQNYGTIIPPSTKKKVYYQNLEMYEELPFLVVSFEVYLFDHMKDRLPFKFVAFSYLSTMACSLQIYLLILEGFQILTQLYQF